MSQEGALQLKTTLTVASDQSLVPLSPGFTHLPGVLSDSEQGPTLAREHRQMTHEH